MECWRGSRPQRPAPRTRPGEPFARSTPAIHHPALTAQVTSHRNMGALRRDPTWASWDLVQNTVPLPAPRGQNPVLLSRSLASCAKRTVSPHLLLSQLAPAGSNRREGWWAKAPRAGQREGRRLSGPQPLDAVTEGGRLLALHTPDTQGTGAGRRRKTKAQLLLPLRPLNPHESTRNHLRFAKVGIPAKCRWAGSRGTC